MNINKMNDLKLPSNKKFGFFFTFVFFVVAGYFFLSDAYITAFIFITIAVVFLTITLVKADYLIFLNKLWMKLGQLLGIIISPIVLAIIFFGLFTPYGLIMRLFKRDELRLKLRKRASYWKFREQLMSQINFTKQF